MLILQRSKVALAGTFWGYRQSIRLPGLSALLELTKEQRVTFVTMRNKICSREGRRHAAMAKRKRHSRAEIATKLAQANELVTQGKLQSEIARTLGVSVMTLYRWRKAPPGLQRALVATAEAREPDPTRGTDHRIAELQLENSRLRRLVTDLLLEKVKLEEAAQRQGSVA
jgi:transposase